MEKFLPFYNSFPSPTDVNSHRENVIAKRVGSDLHDIQEETCECHPSNHFRAVINKCHDAADVRRDINHVALNKLIK